MRQLTQREQQILGVCGAVIFLYVSFRMVWIPSQSEGDVLKAKIEARTRLLEKDFKILQNGKTIAGQYDRYLSLLKQEGTDEQEMSAILSLIESLGNEIQLRFSQMKPLQVQREDFYSIFPVSLSMEDSLPKIDRFLYTVQNQPNFFEVEEIHLEKSSTQNNFLQARLVLKKKLIPEKYPASQ